MAAILPLLYLLNQLAVIFLLEKENCTLQH